MKKLNIILLIILIGINASYVNYARGIMKTIGLLGGTGWSSTIGYYKLLNELVAKKLGGFHSAKILLKSIDYHEIMSNYGKNHDKVAQSLKNELADLIKLKPDCIIICCNSLHKYYDIIAKDLNSTIPVFHAVDLVAEHLKSKNLNNVLLLATKFTMEDGFFAKKLEAQGIKVVIPSPEERNEMQRIHGELMQNTITQEAKNYFSNLIKKNNNLDAVILGCTEYPLVVSQINSTLPIVDPVYLQATKAVEYALSEN